MEERHRTIFHVATAADWAAAERRGEYTTSTRGRSLDDEGFIHCAHGHQVDGILAAIFGDVEEDLVVLAVDVGMLDAEVRDENLDGGTDLFPHVYGAIPVAAVRSVRPVRGRSS